MCIIVVKPIGKKLDKSVMRICWEKNNDGAGFMYALDNKIIIKKELKDFDKIWKQYTKLLIETNLEEKKNIVFHFRIQTHGNIDEDNCHPFYINNGQHMAFCHNGTISSMESTMKDAKSDTVKFRDQILNHLPKNWMNNPALVTLVYKFISYNKLAFLHSDGMVNIMNKSKGEEDKGIWYSNSGYKPTVVNVYNVHDKRQHYSGFNKGWDSDEFGDWRDDRHYKDGRTYDHYLQKWVDSTAVSHGIKDNIRAATTHIDNKILITEADTISEIIIKLKRGGIIEESPEQAELAICKKCGAPLTLSSEVLEKKCSWCAANDDENVNVYGFKPSEEYSGRSRSQLQH